MQKSIILSLILSFSGGAVASDWYPSSRISRADKIGVEPLYCPTIGKDYSFMIGELQRLQDTIKKDANCSQLVKNLEKMGTLTGQRRTEFLDAIEALKKGEVLKDVDLQKKVIGYVEDVTVASGTLAVLLGEGDHCMGEQDPTTTLLALSSFVNEASTLLATVAGPWGPALAIGGKVTAGFLSGIGKYIASRPGFKFYDKKNWQSYVETLCSFHELQDELDALIHPEQAEADLTSVQNKVHMQIRRLQNASPLGDTVMQKFEERDSAGLSRAADKLTSDLGSEAGVKMVQLLTAQRWIVDRIVRIKKDANDPLAPSRHLIQKYRDEIEDFLIERQGPLFIQYHIEDAREGLKNLDEFVFLQGAPIYGRIIEMEGTNQDGPYHYPSTENIIQKILASDEYAYFDKGPEGAQLASQIVYFKRELAQKFDSITLSYGVKQSFCKFFERAGHLNQRMGGSCYSSRADAIETSISNLSKMGLKSAAPSYLKRASKSRGLNWAETLDVWVNTL
jgi:hypothetical protein